MIVKALYQLIKQYGSRQKLAVVLGIDVPRLSELINGYDVSLKLALKIDCLSRGKIPAEKLLEHCGKRELSRLARQFTQAYQRRAATTSHLAYFVDIPLLAIKEMPPSFGYEGYPVRDSHPLRPLLIDEDNRLLSNAYSFQLLKAQGVDITRALVVNLTELLEAGEPLTAPCALTPLEKLAIALALEIKLKAGEKAQRLSKKGEKMSFFCPQGGKIITRKDSFIAKLSGIGSKNSLHRLKQILKKGIPALLHALEDQLIDIRPASDIADFPGEQQQAKLTDFLHQQHKQKETTL